jgi:methylation protein EvaC
MPVANAFLRPEQFQSEYFYDLAVGCCETCHLSQLTRHVDPARLFHSNYAYFSSNSDSMARHFEQFAREAGGRFLAGADPLVVEIGSNDGIMLRHLAQAGFRHLGVEPSANVAEVARSRGVRTLCRFFDEGTAREAREEHGPADLIFAANVVSHIQDLHGLVRAVAVLLRDDGALVLEEPYLGDIVARTSYDQFYAEHAYYFSLHSLSGLFAGHDFEVVDVLPQPTHGGSMRYVVGRRGARRVADAVGRLREWELAHGLTSQRTFLEMGARIERSRRALVELLSDLRRSGKRVTGYGATAKSTTVTNYCRLGPETIEFISDTTPGKQGTFNPGMHIPVVAPEQFARRYPDYAVLFAWNYTEEILAKEQAFRRQGGRFITYVPAVGIKD